MLLTFQTLKNFFWNLLGNLENVEQSFPYFAESSSPEENTLLEKKIEQNIVENPIEFHYSEPTFTRNLLKKAKEGLTENGGGRRVSDENETKPFIDEFSASSGDEPKFVLVTPEDR